MRNRFARTKPIILLTGLLMVVLSIAVFINPIGAVETLVRIIGWVLVAFGAVTLVSAFMKGDPAKNAPGELVIGSLAMGPGLVMAIWPKALIAFVWTFIGIIVLLTGVLDILEAGDLRHARSPLATPATVSGAITIVLGVITIITPMTSATLGMLVAAIALMVDGVTEIVFGLGA